MTEPSPDLFPKDLPLDMKVFPANGHTYHVDSEAMLSINRTRWMEKFSTYATLGRNGTQILGQIRRAYDALNEGRAIDCGVLLDDCMKSAVDLMNSQSPIMYICALFINRTDEDRKDFSLELANSKIADWAAEGYGARPFIHWGTSWLQDTGSGLNMTTQTFSVVPNRPSL